MNVAIGARAFARFNVLYCWILAQDPERCDSDSIDDAYYVGFGGNERA
jgi:hypothetical protein